MKTAVSSGKRKHAVARAVIKQGSGVKVNNKALSNIEPELARLKIEEALQLSKPKSDSLSIRVSVHGGGPMSQADAVRLAIAKGIVAFTKDKKIEKAYLEYDRSLLVADVRRKETRKPNAHGKARAKRQKSYR